MSDDTMSSTSLPSKRYNIYYVLTLILCQAGFALVMQQILTEILNNVHPKGNFMEYGYMKESYVLIRFNL